MIRRPRRHRTGAANLRVAHAIGSPTKNTCAAAGHEIIGGTRSGTTGVAAPATRQSFARRMDARRQHRDLPDLPGVPALDGTPDLFTSGKSHR